MAYTGSSSGPFEYRVSRRLFLRLLGAVYFIAFLSLWVQIHGLIGSEGLLPAEEYLNALRQNTDGIAWYQVPTLCRVDWIGCGDSSLNALCAIGCGCSVLVVCGVAPLPALVILWAVYLSLLTVCRDFLSFQWDTLLLETGFFAVFYAPLTIDPRTFRRACEPPQLARWALWWLVFKLIFLSGVTKLLSGDSTWRDLTAMTYHYQTQPIPNPLSWYAHYMPVWVHKSEVVVMFVLEIGAPFLIVTTRRLRHIACVLMILMQVGIAVTGNYGFFNLLSIILCLSLADDEFLHRIGVPGFRRKHPATEPAAQPPVYGLRIAATPFLILLLYVSGLRFLVEIVRTGRRSELPSFAATLRESAETYLTWDPPAVIAWTGLAPRQVLGWSSPFATINGYGLFRVMTTERPEIVIEGSRDGTTWVEYEFRWKPGNPDRRPPVVAPHMPRLDWQMWFAALNPRGNLHWLTSLMEGLVEGKPQIVALLPDQELTREPPKYIRLVMYKYEFSEAKGPSAAGGWWKRSDAAPLTRAMSGSTTEISQ